MFSVDRILSWTLKCQYLKDPERCPKSDPTWKSSHSPSTSFFVMWMRSLRRSAMLWGSGLSWWQPPTTHREGTQSQMRLNHGQTVAPLARCSLFWTSASELAALKYAFYLKSVWFIKIHLIMTKFEYNLHFVLHCAFWARESLGHLHCLGSSCHSEGTSVVVSGLGRPSLRGGLGPATFAPHRTPEHLPGEAARRMGRFQSFGQRTKGSCPFDPALRFHLQAHSVYYCAAKRHWTAPF